MKRLLLATTLIVAAAGTPATAAYDPQLTVTVDPATPGTPAALTATLTQASGESATETERVRFPPAFAFNPGLQVVPCTASQEQAAQCPEESRIGTAAADTLFGNFAGNVYLTRDFRFVVFLRGFGGLYGQEISGYLVMGPDGSIESVLEGLPDAPTTSARVTFENGTRSLFLTPRACGTYTLDAAFASHSGDRVRRAVPARIGGCDSNPRIERAVLTPSELSRRRPRARLTWQLSDGGAATIVTVERIVRAGRFERRRRVARIRAAAAPGANRLTLVFPRAGRYEVTLTSVSAGGREVDREHVRLKIV